MPGEVVVRCYQELNDFLPSALQASRGHPFPARLHRGETVISLVESLGIPHTEVDLVLVNGRSAGFRQRLADGDRVSVYPVFESLDIGAVSRVRPRPLREVRFVLDVHLGRLARLLRLAGFDSLYANDLRDEALSRISRADRRILLTRDRGLLKRSEVTHGYCVRSADPPAQLAEVIARFDLGRRLKPFSICLRCNIRLERAGRRRAAAALPPYVARTYRRFRTCPACGRLYWRGTHWEHMSRMLSGMEASRRANP